MITMKKYIVLASLVLAVAFALGGCGGTSATPPPASNQPITLTTNPNPPKSGDVEVILQVKDKDGKSLDGASALVIADHTEMKGMSLQGKASAQGNGRYAVVANFPMSGKWRLTVQVSKADAPALVQEFLVEFK